MSAAMSSWSELEVRFHQLEPSMEQAKLERQWDSATEDWRLGGKVDLVAGRQFREVSAAAGALLEGSGVAMPADVASEPDPLRRWFRALWFMAGPHDPPITGMMSLYGGTGGSVSVGRVERPAHASAALAHTFQASRG
jgi:hypothetical protein